MSAGIERDEAVEQAGVGGLTGRHEGCRDIKVVDSLGTDIAHGECGKGSIAIDALDNGVPEKLDVRGVAGALLEDGKSAQRIAAVDDGGGEAGSEQSLIERGVTTTDDRDGDTLEEGGIAGGAIRDIFADEFRLAGDAEFVRLRARGDDHGVRTRLARLGGEDEIGASWQSAVTSAVRISAPKRTAWRARGRGRSRHRGSRDISRRLRWSQSGRL